MTKLWKLNPLSPQAGRLAEKTGISTLEAQILINRGISDTKSIRSFLSPQLSDLRNPMLLKDMDKAIDLIISAIDKKENITIYGDYDADGITGTALLMNFFADLEIPVSTYIPKRLDEGYSLNPDAITKLAQDGTRLIITVDCGTSNHKEIEMAQRLGIRVVVTDHHQIPEDFIPPCPVINPHRPDSSFPFSMLAGVGVAFFLAVALRASLRQRGDFRSKPEPDLRRYLDLVAIGTVADMVPLIDQNRIIVKSGIEIMKHSIWPGIKSIQATAGIDPSNLSSTDLAYRLAPRLNAPGRLGDSLSGLELLTTKSLSRATETAEILNTMNIRRQTIEGEIIDQIEENIIPLIDLDKKRTLVIHHMGWHKGVLGIVASRLLARYNRPVVVLTVQDGIATGSGRSIDGFDLFDALKRMGHLFEKYGGHYHAAGLTLRSHNLDAFSDGMERIAKEELSPEDLIPSVEVDAEIALHEVTVDGVARIESLLAPFGTKNPEPIFCTRSQEVLSSRIVGENHLKLKVRQGDKVMDAIGFNMADRFPMDGKTIDLLYTPEIDTWNGYKKVQLRIIDMELSDRVQVAMD